jgi:integrase
MATSQPPGWETLVFPRPVSENQRQSNYVSRNTTTRAIKRTFQRLGWPNLPVATHVARHTMHNVAQEHASALLLRKVVGHKTEKMSLTYTAADAAKVIELGQRVGADLKAGRRSVNESVNGGRSGDSDP